MKIAIAGYGIEGEENYRYWSSISGDITIVDEKEEPDRPVPEGAKVLLGEGSFQQLQDFDLVIRTAGLAPYKIKTDGIIWSSTNEFFDKCPAPIVGITGTKGKGTTCTLLASILKASGRTTHLVGNIGVSALSILDKVSAEDIVVFEMSSFQLWDIKKSPGTAVVLQIEADHLNVHEGMDDYVAAKANIVRHQTTDDAVFYHPTNRYARQIAEGSVAETKVAFATDEHGSVTVVDDMFVCNNQQICSVDALQLLGEHNVENACAAISVALHLGCDAEAVEQGLKDCKGLPHRIEYVGQVDGVDYYNDSYSSAPSATVAAIRAMLQPVVLIIGGMDRGADFSTLRSVIRKSAQIKKILVIGQIQHKLTSLLRDEGIDNLEELDASTMTDIVARAREVADEGDAILLSPGCASFDMFMNFTDRGDQFKKAVQA